MAFATSIDPGKLASTLADWLRVRLEDAHNVQVSNLELPKSSGMSTETVLLDFNWDSANGSNNRQVVVRIAPTGEALFPSYDLELEASVMDVLRMVTHVPIPKILFREWDPAVLGSPFIVMDRVAGQVAADDPPFTTAGWVVDLTDSERARLCDNGLKALAEIHNVDLAKLDVANLKVPSDTLAQHADYWRRYLDWAAEGETYDTLEAGLDYVVNNRPELVSEPVLSWGDSRLGNIIFSPDQSVAAVLDWEMVSAAPPELDLAWWWFIIRHHSEGIGAPLPSGIPDRAQTIARYQELTGATVRDFHYFEVFAALRLAIMHVRVAHLMVRAGLLPEDTVLGHVNPAAIMLADLIGVDAPDGNPANYFGNR
jgi:aminoglycoside phosphotransferase (APT) family kinase protein